jgi:cytoskeletal protein CcmA (bactofilin family)
VFNRRKPETPKPAAAIPTPRDKTLPTPPASAEAAPPQSSSVKETAMARSPFAPPLPATPASSATPTSPASPLRPHVGASSPAPREEGARRTLVVGRGISVQGTVQDAERLVVEGTVEATMINGLTELSITHGGMFKGEVEVDEAEVAGTIDGTLIARQSLIVRSSGRVLGTARCRRLQVEDGGQITGRIEMLNEANSPAPFTPVTASATKNDE